VKKKLLPSALALCAAACGDAATGTKIGNPGAQFSQLRVELTAWSSDEAVATIPHPRALTTGVVITRAILGVEELRLVPALPDGTCPLVDDGPEIEREFTADLVAGTPLPPIEVPRNDRFCEFRVELEEGADLQGTEHGALLGEAELLVEGARGDGTPFVLRTRDIGEIRFRRSTPFTFTADALWYLAFDVASWFAAVELDAASVGTDGTIRIDDRENEPLLEQFLAAFEAGTDACDDDDDDRFENDCDDDDDD